MLINIFIWFLVTRYAHRSICLEVELDDKDKCG